ncbi:MAG: hypothetical protein GY906_18160 [bacterium]|nr:hypothetical protein [bacterium]
MSTEDGIRGTYYKRKPRRKRGVRTSKENSDRVGARSVALPDGIEDFDWEPGQPIENDGTGTVTNRSGGGRVVNIPDWDK